MVVEALQAGHDLTVVDLDPAKLKPLAQRYDVATFAASGAAVIRPGDRATRATSACARATS